MLKGYFKHLMVIIFIINFGKEYQVPSHQQRRGLTIFDPADLSLLLKHEYQDMQVQNSTKLVVPLLQLDS